MKNTITTSKPGLITAAGLAGAGLAQYGVAIGMSHNTSAQVTTELTDLITGCSNYEQGKLQRAALRDTLNTVTKNCRIFAMTMRDVMKPYFGGSYSDLWPALGYNGSLTTPSNAGDLQPMMVTISSYFTAHPAHENPALNITATQATSLYNDIAAAQSALAVQDTVLDGLFDAREQKANTVRRRLRLILDELDMKLDPLDARWLAFGFNKPGADETPDAPVNVKATLIGPTAAAMKWDAAARAQYYRVWKRTVGVDVDPVPIGSPADLDFTIENLASGATIEIYVSAVNEGGESALSQKVTVTTHA